MNKYKTDYNPLIFSMKALPTGGCTDPGGILANPIGQYSNAVLGSLAPKQLNYGRIIYRQLGPLYEASKNGQYQQLVGPPIQGW